MIRPAEALDIAYYLSQRGLQSGITTVNCYVVEREGASMLACVRNLRGGVADVHICCPKQHVKHSRAMCIEFMEYVKSLGFIMIKTDASDEHKRAQNMLIKLGFVRYNNSEFMRVL
jgi:hypothetical protein